MIYDLCEGHKLAQRIHCDNGQNNVEEKLGQDPGKLQASWSRPITMIWVMFTWVCALCENSSRWNFKDLHFIYITYKSLPNKLKTSFYLLTWQFTWYSPFPLPCADHLCSHNTTLSLMYLFSNLLNTSCARNYKYIIVMKY